MHISLSHSLPTDPLRQLTHMLTITTDDSREAAKAKGGPIWRKDDKKSTSHSSMVSEGRPSQEDLLPLTSQNPDKYMQTVSI